MHHAGSLCECLVSHFLVAVKSGELLILQKTDTYTPHIGAYRQITGDLLVSSSL